MCCCCEEESSGARALRWTRIALIRIVSHEQPKQKNKNLVKQQNCKTKKEKTQSDEMKLKASRDRAQDRKDYDVHG